MKYKEENIKMTYIIKRKNNDIPNIWILESNIYMYYEIYVQREMVHITISTSDP